jgi:TonB family protein
MSRPRSPKSNLRFLFALMVIGLAAPMIFQRQRAAAQQATLPQLEAKLQKQYATIEDLFANGPAKQIYPPDFRERLRLWQDDLAKSFADAGKTIDEILKLNPPDAEKWRERSDTMWLYSQPISPPSSRLVYGASEVQKKARLVDAPAAAYPDAARAAKAKGEVRLRLVLASDGTVKYVFPMKPLPHGLTEAAMEAARQIKFEPAIRDGKPASQFATLSYEFKKGRGLPPYFPEHEFYF